MSKKKQLPIKKVESYFKDPDPSTWSVDTLKVKILWSDKVWESKGQFKNQFIWLKFPSSIYVKLQDVRTNGPMAREPYKGIGNPSLKASVSVPEESKEAKFTYIVEQSLKKHIVDLMMAKKLKSMGTTLKLSIDKSSGKKVAEVNIKSTTPFLDGRMTAEGNQYSSQIMNMKIPTKMITEKSEKKDKNGGTIYVDEMIPQAIVTPLGKKSNRSGKRAVKIIKWELWEEWKKIKDNPEHKDYADIAKRWKEFTELKWTWYDFKNEIPSGTLLKVIGYEISGCMISTMGVMPLLNVRHIYYSDAGEEYDDDPDDMYEEDQEDGISQMAQAIEEDTVQNDEE